MRFFAAIDALPSLESMKFRWCPGSSAKGSKADGHGMRVIEAITGSFGEDAHHDQEAG